MEDKIEVGEYVKFKNGEIDKIKEIINTNGERKLIAFEKRNSYLSDLGLKKQLMKPTSFDVIDLIEVGDYVNGYEVLDKYLFNGEKPVLETNGEETNCKCLCNSDIKSIVTKEQFNSVKYEV